MPNYKVLIYPHPILAQRAEEVSSVGKEVKRLIKDMFAIMYREGGVGLAAPQIGISKRIFVASPTGEKGGPEFAFINPVLSDFEGEVWGPEGCLSLPGLSADVPRAEYVRVRGLDERGKPLEMVAEDFLARIIQHETDHLDGKLFVDRLDFVQRQKLLADFTSGAGTVTQKKTDEHRFFRFL